MSMETSRIIDSNVTLSPSKEFSQFSDHSRIFFKKLDRFKDIIKLRGDAFCQRKEKFEHYVDSQHKEYEKEREAYKKKTEELGKKIVESKAQLAELTRACSQLKLKYKEENRLNLNLKKKINEAETELKQQDDEFYKTSENYLAAISSYKDLLNFTIKLDRHNESLVDVVFDSCKKHDREAHAKIEICNDKKFKVLEIYPPLEDDNVTDKLLKRQELLILLYKLRKSVYSPEDCELKIINDS